MILHLTRKQKFLSDRAQQMNLVQFCFLGLQLRSLCQHPPPPSSTSAPSGRGGTGDDLCSGYRPPTPGRTHGGGGGRGTGPLGT